jgi:ubiquinol oxidase
VSAVTRGPVSQAVSQRPPFGPIQRLESSELLGVQQQTLESPRRKASVSARVLFLGMDVIYGRPRTLEKFRVLELIARVPYQAWENVAYVAVTHTAREPDFARRVFERVRESRWEQDNEQWHLLIMEEQVANHPRTGVFGISWIKARVIPQVIAFIYYQLSWLTYAIKPAWSYRMNADFEDHAEHEYALYVQEHPELETTPFVSRFVDDFGSYASLADLFRQISYDERLHKEQSESLMTAPRFT